MLSVSDDDCESNYENKMARTLINKIISLHSRSNHEFIKENQLNPQKKILRIYAK